MTIPISVNSNEYYERLREFRDEALVASNWHGSRVKLGGIVFGKATARWRSESGGKTDLKHVGLRIGRSNITRLMPTTLRITDKNANGCVEIARFNMDLDQAGWIDFYIDTYTDGSWEQIALAGISRHTAINNGLQIPTEFDRELLFTELERGASGRFAI